MLHRVLRGLLAAQHRHGRGHRSRTRRRGALVRRQLPNPRELAALVRFEPVRLDRTAARLARAADIGDLRALARRRTPRPAFDYVDGAALAELSYRRTR